MLLGVARSRTVVPNITATCLHVSGKDAAHRGRSFPTDIRFRALHVEHIKATVAGTDADEGWISPSDEGMIVCKRRGAEIVENFGSCCMF